MNDEVKRIDVGVVTAFADAKRAATPYPYDREKFRQDLANLGTTAAEVEANRQAVADNTQAVADDKADVEADKRSVEQSAAAAAQSAVNAHTDALAATAAKEAAQTAKGIAVEAKEAAASSKTGAESARTEANTSAGAAAEAALAAGAAARTATEQAQAASGSAAAAAQSAEAAAESARTLTIDTTLTQAGQAADAKKVGDAVADLKSAIGDISEDINYTSVTQGISREVVGLTIATDENGLIIYGTATASRYVGFFNGQKFVKGTTDAFTKTIDAGTYYIDFQMTGAATTGSIRGTYTTFSDYFNVISTVDDQPHSKEYTFTGDTMLALAVTSGRNYGTSANPTRISCRVYRHSAYDDVAREATSVLYPADKKLEMPGRAADAESTGAYVSETYDVLSNIVKGFPESPQTYEVGGLGNSDGSKSTNTAFIRSSEASSRAIQKGDVVISDGTYSYSVAVYNTSSITSGSFNKWITATSYYRKWYCTAIPDEYVGKYFALKMYKGGSELTDADAAAMSDHVKVIHTGYNKIGYERLLNNSDDIEDIKHPGVYRWNTGNYPANLPKNKAGVMLVLGIPSELYSSQLIIYSDGEMASRYNDNGTWGAFYQSESKFEHFLDRCGRIRFTPLKGGTNTNGGRTATLACLTTGLIECANYDRIKIVTNNNVFCNVLQGSTTSLRRTNTWINSGIINKDSESRYIAVNMYLVADDGTNVDWQVADFDLDVVVFGEQNHYEFKNDVPESYGVFNAMRRAYQMADITFTALAPVPYNAGDKPAGYKYGGMAYSSVWNKMNGFVPQTVSFHTYMTAAKDPNSYLYTDVGGGDERRPYYGSVCSTTVEYALDLPGLIATVSMPSQEYFEVLDIDDYHDVRLGDLLVSPDEHVLMIIGISRNQYGIVNSVETVEGYKPYARRRWIPASGGSGAQNDLAWYFNPSNGYIPVRYKYINKVKYQADPWVNVLTETGTPTYPTTICPKKGDKSIYSPSEHVIIDLLDTSESTGTLSNGTTSTTVPLSGTSVDLGTLSGGKWTFTVVSESVSFIVVDVSRTVTKVGEKTYNVAFTNDNPLATPLNISIHHPTNHGCSNFHVLTAEEIENGSAVVSHASTNGRAISVCYTTEYGWYYDGFTDVDVE